MAAPKSFLAFAVQAGKNLAAEKSAKARSAQATGKRWEQELVGAFLVMREKGTGVVVKTNPPVVMKKGGGFAFASGDGCDFIGAVHLDAAPVSLPLFLDAKTLASGQSFCVVKSFKDARERARRLKQAKFIADARGKTPLAGYLLFVADIEAALLLNDPDDLDALARGESVQLRESRNVSIDAVRPSIACLHWPRVAPWPRMNNWPVGVLPLPMLLGAAYRLDDERYVSRRP